MVAPAQALWVPTGRPSKFPWVEDWPPTKWRPQGDQPPPERPSIWPWSDTWPPTDWRPAPGRPSGGGNGGGIPHPTELGMWDHEQPPPANVARSDRANQWVTTWFSATQVLHVARVWQYSAPGLGLNSTPTWAGFAKRTAGGIEALDAHEVAWSGDFGTGWISADYSYELPLDPSADYGVAVAGGAIGWVAYTYGFWDNNPPLNVGPFRPPANGYNTTFGPAITDQLWSRTHNYWSDIEVTT